MAAWREDRDVYSWLSLLHVCLGALGILVLFLFLRNEVFIALLVFINACCGEQTKLNWTEPHRWPTTSATMCDIRYDATYFFLFDVLESVSAISPFQRSDWQKMQCGWPPKVNQMKYHYFLYINQGCWRIRSLKQHISQSKLHKLIYQGSEKSEPVKIFKTCFWFYTQTTEPGLVISTFIFQHQIKLLVDSAKQNYLALFLYLCINMQTNWINKTMRKKMRKANDTGLTCKSKASLEFSSSFSCNKQKLSGS